MPYIDEPVGRVKLQTTRYLLSNCSFFFAKCFCLFFWRREKRSGKRSVARVADWLNRFLQYKITNCPNNRTISQDICTLFARYLYSTLCSWIIISTYSEFWWRGGKSGRWVSRESLDYLEPPVGRRRPAVFFKTSRWRMVSRHNKPYSLRSWSDRKLFVLFLSSLKLHFLPLIHGAARNLNSAAPFCSITAKVLSHRPSLVNYAWKKLNQTITVSLHFNRT